MTRRKQGFSGRFLTVKKPPKAGEITPRTKPSKWLLRYLELRRFLKGYPSPENLAESLPATMSAKWSSAEIRYLFSRKSRRKFPVFSFQFLTVFNRRRQGTLYPSIPPQKCLTLAPDLTHTYSTLKICAL